MDTSDQNKDPNDQDRESKFFPKKQVAPEVAPILRANWEIMNYFRSVEMTRERPNHYLIELIDKLTKRMIEKDLLL